MRKIKRGGVNGFWRKRAGHVAVPRPRAGSPGVERALSVAGAPARNKKARARGWGGGGGRGPCSLQASGRAGLQGKEGDTEEALQTPRRGRRAPRAAAQERHGCHQRPGGVWSSRTPGPEEGAAIPARPWPTAEAFPHVSPSFHWPRGAFATCPVLTGGQAAPRESGVRGPCLPEGIGPVLCLLICMLRSVRGNYSVPPAPGAHWAGGASGACAPRPPGGLGCAAGPARVHSRL